MNCNVINGCDRLCFNRHQAIHCAFWICLLFFFVMRALADICLTPVGTSSSSIGEFVAHAVAVLRRHREVKVEVNSTCTSLEGELSDVTNAITDCIEATAKMGVRVVSSVHIDVRSDKELTIEESKKSIQEKVKAKQSSWKS